MIFRQEEEFFVNESFEQVLCRWYESNHRKLPWRETSDPYKIWISETMLQQTRVETVIPYYFRFLEQFPTVQDLAKADEQQVLKIWEGLGYYSRARNLHVAAKEITEKYCGKLPYDPKEFLKLKGFGPYTTGAVASIAYNLPVPAVDGNVMRVMSRIEKCFSDITRAKTKKEIEGFVRAHMKNCAPCIFNQALMELGATVCLPKNPKCLDCPVQKFCQAYQDGCALDLPIKSKAKARKKETHLVFYARDHEKRTWVQKRPNTGLLANLYELPHILVGSQEKEACRRLKEDMFLDFQTEDGVVFRVSEVMLTFTHLFTHIEWELMVADAKVLHALAGKSIGEFCTPAEIEKLPFAAPFLKIINTVFV